MMSMAAFTKKAKDSEMLESICPYLTAIFLPADIRHHELSNTAHSNACSKTEQTEAFSSTSRLSHPTIEFIYRKVHIRVQITSGS